MSFQKNPLPLSLIIISVVLLSALCGKQEKVTEKVDAAKTVQPEAAPDSAAQIKAHADTTQKKNSVESIGNLDSLNALVDGTPGKLLVFDLYADWCRPCRMLAPVFHTLADTHQKNARFFRIDVQSNPDIAQAFGVRGLPYVVFIKDKKVVHALTGLNPTESYERVITTCGAAATVEECEAGLEKL
jgi:thioredoxin 1